MSAVAMRPAAATLLDRLRGLMLWLVGFSGAFVFMEPSPYEFVALATMALFFLTGLPLRPSHAPLLLLLVAYGTGLSIGLVPVIGADKTIMWTTVSWFLIGTALFYACALAEDTGRRLKLLLAGYIAAALIAALLAILAYFQFIPGAEELLRYSRARGTFKDPNVLGPFLVLPALLAMYSVFSGGWRGLVRGGGAFVLFAIALLLTFSRGAWAHFAISVVVFLGLLFALSDSARERTRIVLASLFAASLVAVALVALLSTETVGALFAQRATLDQSYDVGYLGRFGRHVLGLQLALDHPFGIGPLQFARLFREDAHNVYLNSFMAGGWIAGLSYLLVVVLTLIVGFRGAIAKTPWRPALLAVFAAFVGIVVESAIIDSDHWRHFWLLVGVLWGGAIAAARFTAQRPSRTREARLTRAHATA